MWLLWSLLWLPGISCQGFGSYVGALDPYGGSWLWNGTNCTNSPFFGELLPLLTPSIVNTSCKRSGNCLDMIGETWSTMVYCSWPNSRNRMLWPKEASKVTSVALVAYNDSSCTIQHDNGLILWYMADTCIPQSWTWNNITITVDDDIYVKMTCGPGPGGKVYASYYSDSNCTIPSNKVPKQTLTMSSTECAVLYRKDLRVNFAGTCMPPSGLIVSSASRLFVVSVLLLLSLIFV